MWILKFSVDEFSPSFLEDFSVLSLFGVHLSEVFNLVNNNSRLYKIVMSNLEANGKTNINKEIHNSNESSSSLTNTTSAQNDESQPNSNADNLKTSSINICYPPPPGSGSDDDYDDYYDDEEYSYGSDYDYDYNDYGGELDPYDDQYIGDEEEYLSCTVCEKMKLAVSCASCSAVYCRRDAAQNIYLTKRPLCQSKSDFISYECNACLKRSDNDLTEWRGRKVLTLEMLCAFNIAQKMWETIYADKKLMPLPWKVAMGKSLSIMSSVDKSYADSPLIIRNIIKRAVFLLGLELDFFDSHENNDPALATILNGAVHASIGENISHSENSLDGKSSCDNGENDDAEKSDNKGADDDAEKSDNDGVDDKNDCWEDHEIEWTPQFTIKKLDDRDV